MLYRNNSVRDIDKYADEALAINRMVEQGIGNVSLSQSRSSSFYLEVSNGYKQDNELKTRLVDDFADTPTDSPDDENNYDNSLRRKTSSSSSLFFRNKLQDSLNSMNQQQQQQQNPIFKIGDDSDNEYVQRSEFNLNIGDEFLLPSRLLQASISGDNKLNNTVTAPINMKKTNSYADLDDLALSSTLKESNMIISSSSSSGCSVGDNQLETSLTSAKKKNNRRCRQKAKLESLIDNNVS